MEENQNENFTLHIKNEEDVLEISSTGYGLESVSINKKDSRKFQEKKDNHLPGCGGL